MRVVVNQKMEVDTALTATLHVEFNITFPALPCRTIRVDSGDVGGAYETESMMAQAK